MYRTRRVMNGEAELEQLLEQMDEAIDQAHGSQRIARGSRRPIRPDIETFDGEAFDFHTIQEMWRAIPPDLKSQLLARARQLWSVRDPLLRQLLGLTAVFIVQQRMPPLHALQRAAQQLRLPPRSIPSSQGGMRDVQVKQYHRRQEQRGRRPGQLSTQPARGQGEAEILFEWETGYRPSQELLNICRLSGARANQLRQAVQQAHMLGHAQEIERVRKLANVFVRRWANQMIGKIHTLHRNDIDRLLGCLARLEHAVGSTLPALGPLRAAARQRLSIL
jgi:hypothetical protein